jgi:hypothetical protein
MTHSQRRCVGRGVVLLPASRLAPARRGVSLPSPATAGEGQGRG